ncbi:hypothetical protein D7223_23200 [Micromonospora endolithica]|uniref:DUF3592 domain-containing protein n=2 Tax=Micromonospora endolithica TaxID=230091 RepID=A0A3A9Z2E1_9ACTN|nr:hypothetical protein D7223_23200 [Micromonospora endolithica]
MVGLMAGAFLLVGMGLLGGSLGYRWHVAAEAERLRGEGTPVTATVVDRSGGGGRGSGIDRIEIVYVYDSAGYRAWIPCAGVTGCRSTPQRELTIRVDRNDPERFVAENGHTDGSLSFLMSWTVIPMGVVALVGAGVLGLVFRDRDGWA